MKKIILLLALCSVVVYSSFAQHKDKIHFTFFGSSVCYGANAENYHGYAWQVFNNGAIDTTRYAYFNASTGGDNTLKVEKEERMTKKLYPTHPNIVVIGLSLGNEGIRSPQDDNGRELILEQYRSRLLAMADSFHTQGIKPVIVNCYAYSYFNEAQYAYTKKMNRLINTWDYPSINVLGSIDDLEGRWVEGFVADPWHPNTAGHQEMSYAIVPSLFDAMLQCKNTPAYDWNKSYATIVNKKQIDAPLTIDIENTMHSFTISFRFKETQNGSIGGFVSNNEKQSIGIKGHNIQYKDITTSYPKHLKNWTHVVLAHSYTNELTMLYVNGALVGSVKEQLMPTKVVFGGTSQRSELKDLALHRSCLNEDEARDLFTKKFIQSSLEFYNPMTKPIDGNLLENEAQSLTKLKIDKAIEFEHTKVELY